MINDYETEARSRWGNTDAYREHEQKTKNYTKEKWAEANDGLMAIFAEFAACKASGATADSDEAQALVAKLQAHITANYYELLHTRLCSIPRSSRRTVRMTPRKVACRSSAAHVSASDIRPSRCSIRPWICKREQKTSLAGRHRSFSMKWIIVMEF